MGTRQWELRCRVIEGGWLPHARIMTGRAVAREPSGRVWRVTCGREIRLVAAHARCRRCREDIVRMAGRARHGNVCSCEWECGFRMVK